MVFPSTDLDVIVEVYLGADPTADPSTWPAATDLSSRLVRKPVQIRRGRGQNQKTAQAGSCTFWLENTDGALTPLLPTSTYYPDWDLGVPVRLSVDNVGPNPPHIRHAGFVADISAVMIPGVGGVNISAVQVTSAGVLRRISQGAVEKSALRRTYLNASHATPLAYWPCEDDEGATSIASGLAGGSPMVGVTPHFGAGITGSSNALDLMQVDVLGLVGTVTLPTTDGLQIDYSVLCDHSEIVLGFKCGDIDTVLLAVPSFADGLPHHQSYIFQQNGATVDWSIYRDGVFISTAAFAAGTLGSVLALTAMPSSPLTATELLLGHIVVYSFADATAPTTRAAAVNGYTGEQAHVRVERLCAEEGIPHSGTALQSNECGPQPVGDVIAVLQDAEAVDHGMLIEDFAFGLDYRASSQRFNLEPVITVDLSTYRTTSGTQADVLTPIRNDAQIRNEWTITRPDGSSATAKDETHQAKKGRYNDSATVNVEDDTRILDEAQWRVHEGTFDGLRYETIPLDLGANA